MAGVEKLLKRHSGLDPGQVLVHLFRADQVALELIYAVSDERL